MVINNIYGLVFIIVFNVIIHGYTTIYHFVYNNYNYRHCPQGDASECVHYKYHTVLQRSKWSSGSK